MGITDYPVILPQELILVTYVSVVEFSMTNLPTVELYLALLCVSLTLFNYTLPDNSMESPHAMAILHTKWQPPRHSDI